MFKRGKKSKTSTPASSTYEQPPPPLQQYTPSSQAQTPAPQLPPIQNASPITASDTSKPLPPTHPLATGQHDERMEAVPQNKDAQPGPPEPMFRPAETPERAQQPRIETTSPISPPDPNHTTDGAHDGDVSAMSVDASPQPPPKTDSGIDQVEGEDHSGI